MKGSNQLLLWGKCIDFWKEAKLWRWLLLWRWSGASERLGILGRTQSSPPCSFYRGGNVGAESRSDRASVTQLASSHQPGPDFSCTGYFRMVTSGFQRYYYKLSAKNSQPKNNPAYILQSWSVRKWRFKSLYLKVKSGSHCFISVKFPESMDKPLSL